MFYGFNEANDIDVDDNSPSYDDLLFAFEELHYQVKKWLNKLGTLKNENVSLPNTTQWWKWKTKIGHWKRKIFSICYIKSLGLDSEKPNKEIIDLKRIFEKFSEGKVNFEYILDKRQSNFNKEGLDKTWIQTKCFRNYFVEASNSSHPSIKCNYCGENGRSSYVFFSKNLMAWKKIEAQKD